MAAPRAGVYTPRSGILAGRSFVGAPGTTQAYNRYQQARARALGLSGYAEQRRLRKLPEFQAIRMQEYHLTGQRLTREREDELLTVFARNRRIETVVESGKVRQRLGLDVDTSDHTRGGSLDRYLQALGRRTGNEPWNPGETP